MFFFSTSASAALGDVVQEPELLVLEGKLLARAKVRTDTGDPLLQPALDKLRAEAEAALAEGPFTVVNESTPPSGDPHDYTSVGPYWWPDPKQPDGLPYIRRDGEVNPDYHAFDNVPLSGMCSAVNTLALAWYFTAEERYAERAALLLRTFFLDEATRMNPNLNFGQAIPGRVVGRGIGIIDTTNLIDLTDSVLLLRRSEAWTPEDHAALQAWFGDYLKWLLESPNGKDERRQHNNHGTWYDAQVAAYALFVGQEDVARDVLSAVPENRIATHIKPDGSQPHELARTKSFSYSIFNLGGFFDMAALGRHVGVDLWQAEPADAGDLRDALDWLVEHTLGGKEWTHQQLGGVDATKLAPLLRRATHAYDEPHYGVLAANLEGKTPDERWVLLWPLPAAVDIAMVSSTYESGMGAPRLDIERMLIWAPGEDWTYSHHPHITFFNDEYYAIWSNGHRDEDAPGQRVMLAKSRDFANWTAPAPLVDSLPGKGDTELVLTAAGFHQHAGTLVAYFGQYEVDKTDTRLRAVTTTDGASWSAIRDMGIPVNPNHGPQPTRTDRLIICGNFTFPYTDDPSGLSGWNMTGIYPPDMAGISDDPASFWRVQERMGWPAGLCEGSFFQTDDGAIHMLLRSTGAGFKGRLWITESRDDGETWAPPVETPFSDSNTKFHFGRLPDGRFYYVGCPDTAGRRCPLVLSLSRDGKTFDQHYIIANEPYEMKKPGKHKGGEYGYPHTLIHDGHLCVIVSRQKEAVEVMRFPLAQVAE